MVRFRKSRKIYKKKQNKTKQNKTKQNKTKQNKTKQNKYLKYKKGGGDSDSDSDNKAIIEQILKKIMELKTQTTDFYVEIQFPKNTKRDVGQGEETIEKKIIQNDTSSDYLYTFFKGCDEIIPIETIQSSNQTNIYIEDYLLKLKALNEFCTFTFKKGIFFNINEKNNEIITKYNLAQI